ncbi:ABC-2 family transporter protein [Candidatus Gottesmanbacteria bacterium]|nr:ABC-2 family transporter protein [Candidatus Gottesmanbacteria bacterium]
MSVFFHIIRITWQEMLEYRLNFVLWRVRFVLQRLVVYFLWWALFSTQTTFFDYTQSAILTYVLLVSIVATFVTGTKAYGVGELITQGGLSNILIRPLNFFSVYIARDTADKLLNLLFGIVEIALLIMLLRPNVFFQANGAILIATMAAIAIGIAIYFCYAMMHGLLAFWLPDVWAPRFLSFVIMEFFTGALFPLDILPKPLFTLAQLLPFQYFMYFPVKVYLGQMAWPQIITGFAGGVAWIIVFLCGMILMWKRGLRVYTSEGR